MKLEFLLGYEKEWGVYGAVKQKFKRLSFEQIVQGIQQDFVAKKLIRRFLISSCIDTSIFREKHLMVFDCDSPQNLNLALGCLRRDNYDNARDTRCAVYESTPDRFWIITNFIGKFKEIIKKVLLIEGVDQDWLKMCEKQGRLLLRAFPKNAILPRRLSSQNLPSRLSLVSSPASTQKGRDQSQIAWNWIVAFDNYWNKPQVQNLCIYQTPTEKRDEALYDDFLKNSAEKEIDPVIKDIFNNICGDNLIQKIENELVSLGINDSDPLIIKKNVAKFLRDYSKELDPQIKVQEKVFAPQELNDY